MMIKLISITTLYTIENEKRVGVVVKICEIYYREKTTVEGTYTPVFVCPEGINKSGLTHLGVINQQTT